MDFNAQIRTSRFTLFVYFISQFGELYSWINYLLKSCVCLFIYIPTPSQVIRLEGKGRGQLEKASRPKLNAWIPWFKFLKIQYHCTGSGSQQGQMAHAKWDYLRRRFYLRRVSLQWYECREPQGIVHKLGTRTSEVVITHRPNGDTEATGT